MERKETSLNNNIPNALYQELTDGVKQYKQGMISPWDELYKEAKAIENARNQTNGAV